LNIAVITEAEMMTTKLRTVGIDTSLEARNLNRSRKKRAGNAHGHVQDPGTGTMTDIPVNETETKTEIATQLNLIHSNPSMPLRKERTSSPWIRRNSIWIRRGTRISFGSDLRGG
jgi:hypothetical protein